MINHNAVDIDEWPAVTAVIPARNEALHIGVTVRSLLDQRYPGFLDIVVVDDNSSDGTAVAARAVVRNAAEAERVSVISAAPLADGWVGKMWAVHQGVEAAGKSKADATYLLLTDADIRHGGDMLRRLVEKAEVENLGLVSLMVRLHCVSGIERLLIPAFVYFFQMLYPFPWVNGPARRTAAAAGGCILVRSDTLVRAGGIETIKDRLIDDCALAAAIKPLRPIWLGLAEETHSLRPYDGLSGVWDMVARTAYVQLGHRPSLLLGTVLGMALLYLAPPLATVIGAVSGDAGLFAAGLTAWAVMAWTYLPVLDLYRLSAVWAPALPLAGGLYTLMTLDSARQHYAGRGGAWKDRTYGDSGGNQA